MRLTWRGLPPHPGQKSARPRRRAVASLLSVWGTRVTILLSILATRASAQASAREFSRTRDLTIDGSAADLVGISSLSVSPNGLIAVGQRDDASVRVYDAQGALRYRFGRRGEGPGEFRQLGAWSGWLRDTLWVIDPSLRRLTFVASSSSLARVSPFPASNSASHTSPPTPPRQGDVYVAGVRPDGGLLLAAGIAGTPQPDPWRGELEGALYTVWSATDGGRRQAFLGTVPTRNSGCTEGPFSFVTIECQVGLMAFSPNGEGFVSATPATRGTRNTALRLLRIGASGDTLLRRDLPYVGQPVPRHLADSARQLCKKQNPQPERQGACERLGVAPFLRHFSRVVLGMDDSILLELRPDSKGRHWLVVSSRGEALGRVTLPPTFYLWTATQTTLWGTERDSDDVESVVRYRIGR